MGYCLKFLSPLSAAQRGISFLLLFCFLAQCFFSPQALAWGEFTYKDEEELGKKFNILVKSQMPLIQDPEVTKYIQGIVTRLSKHAPPQIFPFKPSVIYHTSMNAFATPGGYLFVNTGLILNMDHESELAAVIAHEMAHITQRHIAGRIENSQLISLLSVVGALAGAFLGGDAGAAAVTGSMAAGQAAMLNYSRGDENEADHVGMNMLIAAKYTPRGMVGAFEKMSRKQWVMGSKIPTYLSTHPGLQDRVKDLGVRVKRLPAAKQQVPEQDKQFFRIQTIIRARYSDPGAAVIFFDKAMGGPDRCMALLGKAILFAKVNKVAEASSLFEDALECNRNDQLVLREAGRFHYTKGNRNKGAELLQKALEMDRNDVMALFFYARSLADSGRVREAITYTRELLRIVPEDSEVHFFLSRYYGTEGLMFEANLHMTYSALYENDKKKVKQFFEKTKSLARTPAQKQTLERLKKIYDERKEFWR